MNIPLKPNNKPVKPGEYIVQMGQIFPRRLVEIGTGIQGLAVIEHWQFTCLLREVPEDARWSDEITLTTP